MKSEIWGQKQGKVLENLLASQNFEKSSLLLGWSAQMYALSCGVSFLVAYFGKVNAALVALVCYLAGQLKYMYCHVV